ncbi:MAG: hypothetical protein LUE17_17655 [Planctomycetaceae bacterium]|nr:hypothetical protein [Planctomycetaceae bacterium]
MHKRIIWALAAIMFASVIVTPLQAMEPLKAAQSQELVANGRGRPAPRRDRDRGRDHDRGRRDHRRHSNSGWGWAIAGAVVGGAIASSIAESSRPAEPVLVCDAYGNCYYVYQ